MLSYLLSFAVFFFTASVKFLFVPMAMIPLGKTFWETVLTSTLGASFGVVVFYYFGKVIFDWWAHKRKPKPRKNFTPSRRRLVRTKNKFGIVGICFLSAFISVPIASILAAKFFGHRKTTPFVLMLGFFIWSLIITSLTIVFKGLF